jgi:uncharacterized protein YecT (DUF1311 family)
MQRIRMTRLAVIFVALLLPLPGMADYTHTDIQPLEAGGQEINCDPSAGLVDGACLEREGAYDPCHGAGAADFGKCAQRSYERADAELNRIYRTLMAQLPDAGRAGDLTKAKLREDQRRWIRWKESHCAALGEKTGAVQMWKSAYTVDCYARATARQTQKLKRLHHLVTEWKGKYQGVSRACAASWITVTPTALDENGCRHAIVETLVSDATELTVRVKDEKNCGWRDTIISLKKPYGTAVWVYRYKTAEDLTRNDYQAFCAFGAKE